MEATRGGSVELALQNGIPDSDESLVRRVRAGDTPAFGKLVERYMRRAYYAALGLVGSHEDALDLSQEAFARAFRARNRLDPKRPFFAWLYQIIRRLCFNYTRDRRTRRRGIESASRWLVHEAAARSADNPQETLERREARERVTQALESLPDRDREILVLKEFEGLRYREIAELIGIPIGTVMSRLYAARRRLAAALEVES